jgi:hypothetical protein
LDETMVYMTMDSFTCDPCLSTSRHAYATRLVKAYSAYDLLRKGPTYNLK